MKKLETRGWGNYHCTFPNYKKKKKKTLTHETRLPYRSTYPSTVQQTFVGHRHKFIKHSRRRSRPACVTNGRECISRRKNMQLYGVQFRHGIIHRRRAAAFDSWRKVVAARTERTSKTRTYTDAISQDNLSVCNDRVTSRRADKS